MMEIVKYHKKSHEKHIRELLILRNMDLSNLQKTPKNGTLVFLDKVPVAAGFLRLMENNMGMLDSYITNPSFSSEIRNKALDFITNSLVCQAKHLKIQELMAITLEETILNRSLRHNFRQIDFLFSILKLN